MTSEQYARLSAPWRRHPQALRTLRATNKLLTILGYIAYPLLLILLACTAFMGAGDTQIAADEFSLLVRCIAVPAIAFVALSVFRRIFNAPRPYEALDIDPLIKKDTSGRSFPSRHVFSMFMIATCWAYWQPAVGVMLALSGIIMACIRVVAGIHFPRDVVTGALCALVAALIGFVAIPL